jgi:hypothetical protein
MGIRARQLRGLKLASGPTPAFALVGEDFIADTLAARKKALFSAFEAHCSRGLETVQPKLEQEYASLFEPVSQERALGPIFVDLSSEEDRGRNLEACLDAITQFFQESPLMDAERKIRLDLIGSIGSQASLVQVRFDGTLGDVHRIKVAHFRPPRRLNRTLFTRLPLFLAFLFPMLWAGGAVLEKGRGPEAFYDVLAYVFPLVAALAGGMGLFYKRAEALYFWFSAALLASGFVFYLMAKNAGAGVLVVYAAVLTAVLTLLALIDAFKFRHLRTSALDRLMPWAFLIFLVTSLPSLITAYLRGLSHPPETSCQITVAAPAKIMAPPNPNTNTTNAIGGPSGEMWSSERDVVITLEPCLKKKM